MIKRTLFVLSIALLASSCDTLSNLVTSVYSEPTEAEIGSGLKSALEIGISKGSDALSQLDGYFKSPYKILLPPEARNVTAKLKNVPGFSDLENIILEKINRGAEDAAKKAKPIFVSAITEMTFTDALNILMGQPDAATQYLQQKTNEQLYQEFNPVIVESLDKFQARKVWSDAVAVYMILNQ